MNEMSKVISQALSEGRKHLAENEVKQLMKDEGVPTTDFQFVHKISELAMEALRFPCALKVCSPNILHKTDVGGVMLNIESKEALKRSFEAMSKKFPGEGFLVEPMYDAPVEIIIGLINDASFGLTIMFGIGGIFTEIYKDVTFRVVPIKRDDAEEMISEIKAAPILEGFRKIKVDREGVVDLLMKISELGKGYGKNIDQMDLNPVFVSANGVRVIDAKMILR
jgi:acetate---CoA ligase (ADP-forming) subunit beta